MKILHYGIIMLHLHDTESEEDEIKIAKGIVSAVGDVLEGLAKKK